MGKEAVSILPARARFDRTDLKLCGGLTELMDCAEKLPEPPQTTFSPLDSPISPGSEQKLHSLA